MRMTRGAIVQRVSDATVAGCFATLAFGVLCWVPGNASACSDFLCDPTGVLPNGANLRVPANLPGFSATGAWSQLTPVVPMNPKPPVLFRTSGGDSSLPIHVRKTGDGALVLELPALEDGVAYRLEYPEQCSYEVWPMGPPTRELRFRAGPAVPLPKDLGTTVIVSHGDRWLDVADSGGGCTESIWANVADLSASLKSFDKVWTDLVVETWVEVDGARFSYWASIRGVDDEAETAPALHAWAWTNCDARTNSSDVPLPDGASDGLPEGRYEMRVGMRIAGLADPLYGDTQQVELRCEERCAPDWTSDAGSCPSGLHVDAGMNRDAGPSRTTFDAGVNGDAGPSVRPAESSTCQCAVPGTPAPLSWPGLLGLCAVCVRLRRRLAARP